MRHIYKGFKENPLILTEKKIYEHQNTKEIKKILWGAWLFRGHPFILHPARCALDPSLEVFLNTIKIHTKRFVFGFLRINYISVETEKSDRFIFAIAILAWDVDELDNLSSLDSSVKCIWSIFKASYNIFEAS